MTFDVEFQIDDKSFTLKETSAAAAEAAADRAEAAAETLSGSVEQIATNTQDISSLKEDIGDLSDLETTDKSDLVSAINEANQHGGGSGLIITDYDPNDIYLWDDGAIIATGISLNKSSISFSDVGSQTLTATLTPSNAQETITWASSDENVATVVGNGLSATVTAVGNGTATITATTDTTQLSASCAVTASGLPEEGVRYRFTGTDCTTETSQVVGGANITFKSAPTIEDGGVLLNGGNFMLIENSGQWFDGDWTMELVFEPRLSESVLSSASGAWLMDAKYGTLYDGTASNTGQTLGINNPRDNGYLYYAGKASSLDIRPYNNTECTIKIQYSTTASGAVFFNGNQILTLGTNQGLPSTKNIYFKAFNKSSSNFAHLLKSIVIRDGVV